MSSFIKPNQILGVDQVIPPEVLQNAKGLAVFTVFKAGFLFSGRAGSGIIVARLPDGSWSPPSAIVTAGAGAGGQIGFELTDFVYILNTEDAVKTFAQAGSLTLGGNISLAAGPLGRNAEAGGSASLKSVAAIFAYSKTKGLFAGVSLEGSAIIERREANRKFYGNNCKAKQILSGQVDAPPECDTLFRVLESRAFTKRRPGDYYDRDDDYYDDIPDFSSESGSIDDRNYSRGGNRSSARGSNSRRNYSDEDNDDFSDDDYYNSRNRPSTRRTNTAGSRTTRNTSWEDDVYDRYDSKNNKNSDVDDLDRRFKRSSLNGTPSRPNSEKPNFGSSTPRQPKAIALYSFEGEQAGDLPFRKGDVITIVKKSDSSDDWWTGKVNGREGIFPANYVELA